MAHERWLIDLILAAGAAPTGPRRAVMLLAMIVALLGSFVFVVALITVLRLRRRERSTKDRAEDAPADAWEEAGRRMRP